MTFSSKFEAKYGKDGKQFMKKWIAALESGRIKRLEGQLGNQNGMCCLGVACEVLHKDGLVTKELKPSGSWHYGNEYSMPSTEIRKKIEEVVGRYVTCANLAEHNDKGRTFKKTAAVLRTAMKKQGIIIK